MACAECGLRLPPGVRWRLYGPNELVRSQLGGPGFRYWAWDPAGKTLVARCPGCELYLDILELSEGRFYNVYAPASWAETDEVRVLVNGLLDALSRYRRLVSHCLDEDSHPAPPPSQPPPQGAGPGGRVGPAGPPPPPSQEQYGACPR